MVTNLSEKRRLKTKVDQRKEKGKEKEKGQNLKLRTLKSSDLLMTHNLWEQKSLMWSEN
jgi:hypothetical protein